MDFKGGLKNEFDKLFPDVHMTGCNFHWCQDLNNQLGLGKKGCTKFYNVNLDFQDIVANCIVLAYVPLDQNYNYMILIEEA
jgi:hypothetical protein